MQDSNFQSFSPLDAANLNNLSLDSLNSILVDPLVLDLNGDGVRLTDYGSNPVLFDIDNDGGSRELSGWVSPEDGLLVHDLNGNGRIDHSGEIFSEYYGGTSSPEGGTRPFRDGFAALASLDGNHDHRFGPADAAWDNVRVWVDADHDGQTDSGELRTLDSLGISYIDLDATTASGLVRDGNEVFGIVPALRVTAIKLAVIPAWMPESSVQGRQPVGWVEERNPAFRHASMLGFRKPQPSLRPSTPPPPRAWSGTTTRCLASFSHSASECIQRRSRVTDRRSDPGSIPTQSVGTMQNVASML